MFRLKTPFKISWQYALGEIIFIFIGITIAIWFNNWNASLKAKKDEINTIKEIRKALEQDLRDLEANLKGFKNRTKEYKNMLSLIDNKTPLTDSLSNQFGVLLSYTIFVSNTGAFETLKSRGLETISNDSLRLQISTYYEVNCEWHRINEQIYYQHNIQDMTTQIKKHFLISDEGITIVDYQQLLNDFEFRQTLYWQLNLERNMLQTTQSLSENVNSLIHHLDLEIVRLES